MSRLALTLMRRGVCERNTVNGVGERGRATNQYDDEDDGKAHRNVAGASSQKTTVVFLGNGERVHDPALDWWLAHLPKLSGVFETYETGDTANFFASVLNVPQPDRGSQISLT